LTSERTRLPARACVICPRTATLMLSTSAGCSDRFGTPSYDPNAKGDDGGAGGRDSGGSDSDPPSSYAGIAPITEGGVAGAPPSRGQAGQNTGGAPSGSCATGATESREASCGTNGRRPERRSCAASGMWSPWKVVGACVEAFECVPGDTREAEEGTCGYCGTEPRSQTCTDQGAWGEAQAAGACTDPACPALPGDERRGFIECGGTSCEPMMNCCSAGSGSGSCNAKACMSGTRSVCDGPEDCVGGKYCVLDPQASGVRGICSADADIKRRCHADSDCATSVSTPYCLDDRYSAVGKLKGVCVADAPG
jgi:hypothetical protein